MTFLKSCNSFIFSLRRVSNVCAVMMLFSFTQIPSWPTGGGITLQQATEKCQGMLQLSAAATTCSPLVGTLTLDVSLESCLEDILVSGWREKWAGALTSWDFVCQIDLHIILPGSLQHITPCITWFCMNWVLACPFSVVENIALKYNYVVFCLFLGVLHYSFVHLFTWSMDGHL